MKKPQIFIITGAVVLLALLLIFGRTTPRTEKNAPPNHAGHAHEEGALPTTISVDTLLRISKKNLTPAQLQQLQLLEQSAKQAAGNEAVSKGLHALAHFWKDSLKTFLPYAWYTAEGARLENSEKNLTFAGHLFLDRVQFEQSAELKKWMALQAKDLFERSLRLNPNNDSCKVGVGAAYLFGGISSNPMEGLAMIREVIAKDSTHIYAQMTLAAASVMSGQTEKAQQRLATVIRLQPDNVQALLMLGDMHEQNGNKAEAIRWYTQAAQHIQRADIKQELEKRIADLKK